MSHVRFVETWGEGGGGDVSVCCFFWGSDMFVLFILIILCSHITVSCTMKVNMFVLKCVLVFFLRLYAEVSW